jgi:putative solute:sodium symporter small subunit
VNSAGAQGASGSIRARTSYWRGTLRLTFGLLAAWAVVSFLVPFFARDLTFHFLGWPFSFFMASQGSLFVYLAIVGVYARQQARRDEQAEPAAQTAATDPPPGAP